MSTSQEPLFVQMAQQAAAEKAAKIAAQVARQWEKSMSGMVEALTVILGAKAAGEIISEGREATIEGQQVWLYRDFAFRPYMSNSCSATDQFQFASLIPDGDSFTTYYNSWSYISRIEQMGENIALRDKYLKSIVIPPPPPEKSRPDAIWFKELADRIDRNRLYDLDRYLIALMHFHAGERADQEEMDNEGEYDDSDD